MAVFYVLPPRPALGECLARLLRPFLPGVAIGGDSCAGLIETLVNDGSLTEEVYVVHREDLPADEDVNIALCNGYGAESGDRVILVTLGPKPDEPRVRITQLAA